MSKFEYTCIDKGIYTELGSTCTMLGVMKLSNSCYSKQNRRKPYNRFIELGNFINGIGEKRKVVLNFLKESSFYNENGIKLDVDEAIKKAPSIETNLTEFTRPVMLVDNDYKLSNKCSFGGLEEIVPRNTIGSFTFDGMSKLEHKGYLFNGNLIPLDKNVFKFKEDVIVNNYSSNHYTFNGMYSTNKGILIKNDIDITSVRNPGNDCFLSRFLLPMQTEGNIIGMNQFNLIGNRRELELQKIYFKEMGVSSIVMVKGEGLEYKEDPVTYENYMEDLLNKVDLPYILLEDDNTVEFREQIRNLDRGRMIFHLHLDNADKTTGISTSDYLYKDQNNFPSVVRPLVISDILIESLINNLDLQDYILFTIKDLDKAVGQLTEGDGPSKFYRYITHKLDTVELSKEFGVNIADQTELLESCATVLMPYFLNSEYNSMAMNNYYRGVMEGYLCKSKLLYWSNRHNKLVRHFGDEDFRKVHKGIVKYLTPIKELERIIKYRMLDTILKTGISYFINNLDNPNNLLEYILSALNNKIIIIDFIKINLDDKYEDTYNNSTTSKLRKYYYGLSTDDKELNFLKENMKPTMTAGKKVFFNFDNEDINTARYKPLGGSLHGFIDKHNVNNMLEADGYYCGVNEKYEKSNTSVFKSINYFRTTYIDTVESGIDSNKIMYEEKLGILFCKCDRGVLKYFLELNNPKVEDRTKYSNGEFYQYFGQGPTLYRVSNGYVFTMAPIISQHKDGLYRTVYENGKAIVKDEPIDLTDLSNFNITTSRAIADSIAKLQCEMRGRTKIENDDLNLTNKIRLQLLSIKERILEYELVKMEHEVKLTYNILSKHLEREAEIFKYKVNMANALLNLEAKRVDNFVKEAEYWSKIYSNRLLNEENLEHAKEKNNLAILTSGFKISETILTVGGRLLKNK